MFQIIDADGNVHGSENDYGNAAELWNALKSEQDAN